MNDDDRDTTNQSEIKRKMSSEGDFFKRKNPNANINAMFCNRRKRDKTRLKRWIEEEILFEVDPRLRLSKLLKKRDCIEHMWETHYVSEKPRFKNSSPRIAWCDLWKKMDGLIEKARMDIRIMATHDKESSRILFANATAGDRFGRGLPNMDNSNQSRMHLGGSGMTVFPKQFQDTAMERFTAYSPESNNKSGSSKTYSDDRKTPPSNAYDHSSSNKDSSQNRYTPRSLNERYHNSTIMDRMQQSVGGEIHLSDGMNKDSLAIPTDELKEAHISVLQEKISGFKRKILSAQSEASDYRLQADAYVKTILKLNKSNDALEVKSRELEQKLAKHQIRERELRDSLHRYEKTAKLLPCTAQGTQTYQFDFDKSQDAARGTTKRDSFIAELEAENKRLKEENDALKESAKQESENDEGDYLLI